MTNFSSKKDFINYCAQYFTAAFLEENITPWFGNGDAAYLREFNEKLYYRVSDGGGTVGSLDTDSLTFEEVPKGKVVCTCPHYDAQTGRALNSGAIVTMAYENGFWHIDKIEFYDE